MVSVWPRSLGSLCLIAPYSAGLGTMNATTNAPYKEVRARINPSPYRYDEDLLSPLARYLTATTSPRWETYASTA